MIGMALLMCTLLTGFTGYSLVFEQLSYWGATVAANISDAVPVVGGFAKQMLLGGDEYNERTLSRFYILHAAVLAGDDHPADRHSHRVHSPARRHGTAV